MDPFKLRKLGRSNVMLPQLGFGGAPLGELFTKVTEADAEATLAAAWDGGVRYYDTAPWYGRGQSEHRIGRFLYRQPRNDVEEPCACLEPRIPPGLHHSGSLSRIEAFPRQYVAKPSAKRLDVVD